MSAQRLAREVDMATTRLKRKKRPNKKSPGRFLFNSLTPEAKERLQQLRHGGS